MFVSLIARLSNLIFINFLFQFICFLGANAPLGPASSEGLSVCLYVCLYVCNTLAPLPFLP